jgi:hypothetical protein
MCPNSVYPPFLCHDAHNTPGKINRSQVGSTRVSTKRRTLFQGWVTLGRGGMGQFIELPPLQSKITNILRLSDIASRANALDFFLHEGKEYSLVLGRILHKFFGLRPDIHHACASRPERDSELDYQMMHGPTIRCILRYETDSPMILVNYSGLIHVQAQVDQCSAITCLINAAHYQSQRLTL